MKHHLALARRCEALTSTRLAPRLGLSMTISIAIVLALMALIHWRITP
jgi:hypothetical protein